MSLIILDRDGVVNRDSDLFVKSPEEWVPIAGSLEAIARFKSAGFKVGIATNQSGIARGLFTLETLMAIHEKFRRLLAQQGASIDILAFCPHGPDEGCVCRKPQPGMYLRIAEDLGERLEGAPVVGDSLRDLQAAAVVGAQPMLVLTGKGQKTLREGRLPAGTAIYPDLASVADALLNQ